MQTLRFPQDLLKFLYWVFFKPITMDRYIHQIDPTLGKNTDLLTLWRQKKEHPEFRHLIKLSIFHHLITPWPLALLGVYIFMLGGYKIEGFMVVFGIGNAIIFSLLMGLAFSMTGGLMVGIAGGVLLGIAGGVAYAGEVSGGVLEKFDPIFIGMGGIGFGLFFGLFFGTSYAPFLIPSNEILKMRQVVIGVALALMSSLVMGLFYDIQYGSWGKTEFTIGAGIGYCIGYFRLLLYIIEVLFSYLMKRMMKAYHYLSPIMWDELIWFPLPWLNQYLIDIGRHARQQGLERISYVATSWQQGWAAKKAIFTLMMDDVEAANSIETIANLSGTLNWLPQDTRDEMKSLLLGLDEISRHARAALESETPYNRQEQLRLGLNLIESARRGLAADPRWKPGPRLISALGIWEKVFSREYALAREEKGIPNVYVAGSPLSEQSKVFKGRRDIFRALERELVSHADQRPALLLFGARRMGKTSVLRQLPNNLGPQVIPVTIDLQSIALSETAVSLLAKIAASIQNSALVNRHITLPDIPAKGLETDPYRAFSDWMELVGKSIGDRWILLCLDEYEYLEKLLRDGRIDERAFQLLRTLIQNHPRLTLLFSGAHTLDDLQSMWSNYLINVRVIKIQPLSEDDAETLITKPIPNFPLVYDNEALDHILFETGCHPYLIQSTCQDLVHRLNETNRFTAHLKDVDHALDATLEAGAGYFKDLWDGSDSDEVQRAIQLEIAKSKTGRLSISRLETALVKAGFKKTDTQAGINRLIHRDMLEQDDSHVQFQFNLILRWVRVQKLMLR